MTPAAMPRGIRNHNPGNLVRDGTAWQGLAADQTGDSRFCVFESPLWGLRALAKVLLTYRHKHGLRTVAQIIRRYAPPIENNTYVYINIVARALEVGPHVSLTLDEETLIPLVRAIIHHENGKQPYAEAEIAKAVRLALAS